MKKNILIVVVLIMFASLSFGQRKVIRLKPSVDPHKAFIKQKLESLGLKVGKISIVGENGFIALIKGFATKTNALKLTKPFKSFSMKGSLKGKQLSKRGIIINSKPGTINKNLQIFISKRNLLSRNFIIDSNDMPKGIIIH